MALTGSQLLATTVVAKINSEFETIEFDAMISESHRYSNRVTENPVESGGVVTDHIINDPITLRIEALVSDTPLGVKGFQAAGQRIAAAAGGALGGSAAETRPGPAADAFGKLIRLWKERGRVTVVTGLQVYRDMAIESIDIPRDANTGRVLRFQMSLKQIRLASTLKTQVQVAKDTENTALKEVDLARQPTQTWSGA
jgi:hypothetical protein